MTPTSSPTLETLPSITENPSLLLGQIRHFVSECRKLLEEGGDPELTGMDDQVRFLCAQIKKMEPEESDQIRPKLDSLVEELDDLAQALQKQRQLVLEQLEELNRQQKASAAYQKASAGTPKKPEGSTE